MPRLTKIEKLARDICWAEWPLANRTVTKAAYWQLIGSGRRAKYIREAERFVRVAAKVPALLVMCLVRQALQPRRARR